MLDEHLLEATATASNAMGERYAPNGKDNGDEIGVVKAAAAAQMQQGARKLA